MKRMEANIFIVALIGAIALPLRADTIQLRAKATATNANIALKDVAILDGDIALALADKVVATLDESQSSLTLTQDGLRDSLRKAGVNWARVSLKGFEKCLISKAVSASDARPNSPREPAIAPASPILSNPTDEVAAEGRHTVRDRLIDWMRGMHGSAGQSLRIIFADRDAAVLNTTAVEDKFIFTTAASSNLGRVPVNIQRFRGDKLIDSQRITIDVARRHLAVVAAKAIGKGEKLTFDDLRISEVFLDRLEPNLLTKLDDAIGLHANASLREGALVLKDQIRPTLLIQRNELVRVQAVIGGLIVQTYARALEDGGEGQTIQVRNERSRELITVRVIGARTAMLIDADTPGK